MSKPKLIILSDIFGNTEGNWMNEYRKRLQPFFDLAIIDSKVLAGIESLEQAQVHKEFVNGGIERAAKKLRSLEPEAKVIIGFSVGGTIAWKTALQDDVESLYLISATRVRNEHLKPNAQINLYFGEKELHGPKQSWFQENQLVPRILVNESHECYKTPEVVKQVCEQVILDFSNA